MNTMFFSPVRNRRFNPAVIDTMFSDLFTGGRVEYASRFPSVNLLEEETKFSLELVAPGFDKEEVKINLEGNQISISGEKKSEETETKKNYTRHEFKAEKFNRVFTLPENINVEEIKAEFKNGILHVEIPKKTEEKKTKEIVIE